MISIRIRMRVAIEPHQFECEASLVSDFGRTISPYWAVVVALSGASAAVAIVAEDAAGLGVDQVDLAAGVAGNRLERVVV